MTRISSLILATTMAILPISAFAQQAATPAKTTAPTGIMTQAPETAGKSDTKTLAPVAKPQMHSANTASSHAKVSVPAKSTEPAKS
jgi:hypothetical protein